MLQAVAKTKETDESPVRLSAYEERARINLNAWIEASGYSVTKVADLAGIPQANLARYTKGIGPIPLDVLQPLADLFGRASIDDFKNPNPSRPLTGDELLARQPMFAKSRPGFDPTEEDLADFREYVAKVQARREKKLKGKR